jgi:hypothetical protein
MLEASEEIIESYDFEAKDLCVYASYEGTKHERQHSDAVPTK